MKNNKLLQLLNNSFNNKKLIIHNKNEKLNNKYLPPYFKEWRNTMYFYNSHLVKNMPVNIININNIIQTFFNIFLKNYRFFSFRKYKESKSSLNKRYLFFKRVYISKPEIRFTNYSAIITLYTLNIHNIILKKLILYSLYYLEENKWKKNLKWKKNFGWKNNNSNKFIKIKLLSLRRLFTAKYFILLSKTINNYKLFENFYDFKDILKYKLKTFQKILLSYNIAKNILFFKEIKKIYFKYLMLLYKFNHEYSTNIIKFKDNNSISFINKLKIILSNIINRKIELNLINLKSVGYNSDIFTKLLALKFKRKRRKNINIIRNMLTIINKGKISMDNFKLKLKNKLNWFKSQNLLKNTSLISKINKGNANLFSKELNSISKHNKYSIYNRIFNSIKYKNNRGIMLIVKGRLTRRYRADRAIYKLFWKGGLKNLDSSYLGLSSKIFRGHIESNMAYSMYKSKRRIGAFAVKGWVSGN